MDGEFPRIFDDGWDEGDGPLDPGDYDPGMLFTVGPGPAHCGADLAIDFPETSASIWCGAFAVPVPVLVIQAR